MPDDPKLTSIITHCADFPDTFRMSIPECARLSMEDEKKRNPEPLWWYLGYAHETEGFKGGTIVQGHGFVGACDYARRNGITPAPDVQTMGLPVPLDKVPEERYCRRLLTVAELETIWGDMKSMKQIEEEENGN